MSEGSLELVVVGFDTATGDTAVCAERSGELLHESLLGPSADGRPRHGAVLLEEVERAAAAGGGWEAVGLLAVGRGPGSFTGVRIGIATALGLATSTGRAVVGVCTLDAIGRALGQRCAARAPHLAVLNAGRGEVFAALYSGQECERLWDPFVTAPADLLARVAELPRPPQAGGSGALRLRQELARCEVEVPDDADPVHRVAARHICALAATQKAQTGGPITPIYLRPPDAVRWHERDTVKTAK